MSHFTTVKVDVKIDSLDVIEAALKQLGYVPVRLENQPLSSEFNHQMFADISIPRNQISLPFMADVGFRLNEAGSYDLVWDTYQVSKQASTAFAEKLNNAISNQATAHHTKTEAQRLGMTVISETVDENNNIRLVLQQGV